MRISDWSSDVCSSDLSLDDRRLLAITVSIADERSAQSALSNCSVVLFSVARVNLVKSSARIDSPCSIALIRPAAFWRRSAAVLQRKNIGRGIESDSGITASSLARTNRPESLSYNLSPFALNPRYVDESTTATHSRRS